ncbi:hypothetical protein [Devosia sp. SL43]|uniref:hypothetical protein n=1 Tax=Devosia sp. SL43 TaxID=2806348 RepID=UPI001F492E01|nr:hypothetical protein [Devosia sp. SL43]UJW87366.1 hypothetical protein IM737_09080 [Devosia sp. SL43]
MKTTSRLMAAALIGALCLATPISTFACQLDYPPGMTHPTWEDKIVDAEEIFIGRVISIQDNVNKEDEVVFSIETPIRGNLGPIFEALQGSGGDCGIPFEVGQFVLYAGNAIWSPTEFLSDPLTTEQRRKLAFVKGRFFGSPGVQ